jgi:hypothetical protein
MSNIGISALRVGSALRGRDFHNSGNAVTDDLGEFRIYDLRAGRYTITANPPPQAFRVPPAKEKDKVKELVLGVGTVSLRGPGSSQLTVRRHLRPQMSSPAVATSERERPSRADIRREHACGDRDIAHPCGISVRARHCTGQHENDSGVK